MIEPKRPIWSGILPLAGSGVAFALLTVVAAVGGTMIMMMG